MTTYTWVRTTNQATAYNVGWFLLAQVPNGSTLRRIRWSWGFTGTTDTNVDLTGISGNLLAAGINTVIGNGSEIPPTPMTHSGDLAPPTQRWLWWETRQPYCTAIDWTSGVATWRDSGVSEPPDVRTQVLATGIPSGQFLDVWIAYEALFGGWDPSGDGCFFFGASVLYSTP